MMQHIGDITKIDGATIEPPAYTCPICPVCGAETDTVYKNVYGDSVGCPECVTEVDAWAE